ncbi:MAG: S9 family peptidase [Proteobacteria bacterium]|nr:S9 family peptidase [Pseudomonadota bacterium]
MNRNATLSVRSILCAVMILFSLQLFAKDELIRTGNIIAVLDRQEDASVTVRNIETDLPESIHPAIRNWLGRQETDAFFADQDARTLSLNVTYHVFESDDGNQSLAFRIDGTGAVSKPSVQKLFADPVFQDVKISPNGKYLAVVTPVDGKERLAVLDAKTRGVLGNMYFQGSAVVHDFEWVKGDRLLIRNAERLGWQDAPVWYGELFSATAEGKQFMPVFGYRAGGDNSRTGSRLRGAEPNRAWGMFISDIPDDKHEVLIASYPWNVWDFTQSTPTVYRMNVANGALRHVTTGPAKGASFVTDTAGGLRYAISLDSDRTLHIHEFQNDGSWKEIATAPSGEDYTKPIAVSADSTRIFHVSNAEADTDGLYEVHLEDGKSRLLFRDDEHDIAAVYFDPFTHEPLWVRLDAARGEIIYIDSEHHLVTLHKELMKAFPGNMIGFTSTTRDYRKVIAFIRSDSNPGDFYSIDTETFRAEALAPFKTGIAREQLVEMQPVQFKARDGVMLEGYFTAAQGRSGPAPTVVLVHGGPHRHDTWGFDPVVQMLATRGYGVLQVNFRGSTGRGRYFEGAGYGQWGRVMQDDVTDATHWAITEGLADPERTCIVGGSYGGYAAMMGLVRDPELYRCGISMYGVSDIELMFTEGDTPDALWGESYLRETLGDDKAEWAARSPSRLADRIQAPVLLVHGGEDERVPIEHARKMEAALKAAKKPVETFYVETESHGFMNEGNRVRAHELVLEFLDRHIGSGAD